MPIAPSSKFSIFICSDDCFPFHTNKSVRFNWPWVGSVNDIFSAICLWLINAFDIYQPLEFPIFFVWRRTHLWSFSGIACYRVCWEMFSLLSLIALSAIGVTYFVFVIIKIIIFVFCYASFNKQSSLYIVNNTQADILSNYFLFFYSPKKLTKYFLNFLVGSRW